MLPVMELKVWVEGIQRIVCGVTENTTCQDVVYALAHATGKTGRFTLIERWRNNERLLAPQEHPLKVVNKWGECSLEVQLILQRSGGWNSTPPDSPAPPKSALSLTKSLQVKHQHSSQQNLNGSKEEAVLSNAQYRDMVRLVHFQREKISAQLAEITKFDAEINYWETKTREQQGQIEYISQEADKFEAVASTNEQMLRVLGSLEEERELVEQEERTIRSEISVIRSKLANCETELLQCKNKIRELCEELEQEAKGEVALLAEVDRLQREIEQAKARTELNSQSSESLRSQVMLLEAAISEKKRQVERLVSEMKEANLQSLTALPHEELKLLLEGPHKPGSLRRMIGSPRQLENAAPTSKNPHGVWV